MDFSWTAEQEKLSRDFAKSVRETLEPTAAKRGYDASFELSELRACGDLGILGLSAPKDVGGRGFDRAMTARFFEILGEDCGDMGLVFASGAHLFACVMPIVEFGTKQQLAAILPALCAGQKICANAITEDTAGSDVYALSMSAVKEGDDFVLSGEKSYVSNAKHADYLLTYAVTAPEDGFLGISAFLVPRDSAGVTVQEPFDKLGLKSLPGSRVQFDGCRVSKTCMIGESGQGGPIFTASMEWERFGLLAAFLGLAERQLKQAIQYARKRKQFGRAISKNQAISHELVDLKMKVESARLLLYRACAKLDQGQDAATDVAMAKLAISKAAVDCGLGALHIMGGAGYAGAHGAERGLRDALASTIASGTSEMQKDIIARELRL
ncbi:acyl-CoA dehydrogenase family protein [Planktotalea sp.]|uniref:acyl-CoA dehydrogenase family protein n=1 Tax=Planktotalea sp. TaxID=2029877 RepID=UPI003299EF5C